MSVKYIYGENCLKTIDMLIPHKFRPRDYQLPLLSAMDGGCKRAFCLWHRRAGKDKVLWNYIIKEAFTEVGVYYYFFPTYTQAKKVIWDGIDNDGFGFLNHIPDELSKSKNAQELKIELKNGSIIQLVGTDKYDSVRGTNPRGCVFSEYAFHNPLAWEVVRPILAANGGWAIFNTTPNGKNHAYDLWNIAKESNDWFTQILTVDDTNVVDENVLEQERLQMSREMYEQEYFCSFDVGAVGSVYGQQIEQMVAQNRVVSLPLNNAVEVDIFTDLGISDATSMWFTQADGQFFNCVNYYEDNGRQIHDYFTYIKDYLDRNKLKMGKLYLPHDSNKRSLTSSKTVLEIAQETFGAHKVEYMKVGTIQGRINKTRSTFHKFRIDPQTCAMGLRCLENYRFKYDDVKKVFSKDPSHDWASHGSDAFGYMAENIKSAVIKVQNYKPPTKKRTESIKSIYGFAQ